jgi:hypothetical protein
VERTPALAPKENDFIRLHGFPDFAKWHLGVNNEKGENTKGDMSFRTVISGTSTAAQSFPPKAAPANINIPISHRLRTAFTI